jgi:nicotinate-nucleotide adenylyltransferase
MKNVAIYGGSFDPPHCGHLLAITYLSAVAGVDEVWILPAYNHAFGKKLTPFEIRMEMVQAMVADLDPEFFKVKGVEKDVGTGFTLDVVRHLYATHPDHTFRVVLGSDILFTTEKWANFAELCTLASPIVLERAGYLLPPERYPKNSMTLPLKLAEVSSTEIRNQLATDH